MLEAALLMPLQESVAEEFSPTDIPTDVVELRMPPTCTVALRTVDRDGRPFTHPVRGELRVASGESGDWSRVVLRKEQNESFVEFAHVGLGLTLSALFGYLCYRWIKPVTDIWAKRFFG